MAGNARSHEVHETPPRPGWSQRLIREPLARARAELGRRSEPARAAWYAWGWKVRLPVLALVMGGMALLPSLFSPGTSLLKIPDPTLVLFAVGLYVILRLGLGWPGRIMLVALLLYFVDQLDSSQLDTAFLVALAVLLGTGLNFVVGYAGLLDLGFVAFYAIGAYTWGLMNSPFFGLHYSYWLVLPLAVALAATAGVLLGIPVLRLRGDYLAIVTLGFGEIIGRLSNNLAPLTGGAVGVYGIATPAFLGFVAHNSLQQVVYLVLVFCFIAAFIAERLRDSRTGRAWEAIREDEDVAAAMGVNTIYYKLLAFGIGAAFGGLGGTIFAAKVSAISPPNFVLDVSIRAVSIIIIGGMGSLPGIVMGAVVLVGAPEVLRAIQDWRLVIYGGLLVAMMILRPEGIVPSRRRRMEFRGPEVPAAPVVTEGTAVGGG